VLREVVPTLRRLAIIGDSGNRSVQPEADEVRDSIAHVKSGRAALRDFFDRSGVIRVGVTKPSQPAKLDDFRRLPEIERFFYG
jgi:hypothetical protein